MNKPLDDMQNKKIQHRTPVLAITSIALGILGIIVTLIIIYQIKHIAELGVSIDAEDFNIMITFLDKAEIFLKSAGAITAVVGLIRYGSKSTIVKIAILTNAISIILMVCLMYGIV